MVVVPLCYDDDGNVLLTDLPDSKLMSAFYWPILKWYSGVYVRITLAI